MVGQHAFVCGVNEFRLNIFRQDAHRTHTHTHRVDIELFINKICRRRVSSE